MTPLTAERVRYIRAKLAEGWTQRRIASTLGIPESYVSLLKKRHLPELVSKKKYEAYLMDRWLNVHKIGDIGKRAVEETA